jgi:hypothetical protein
MALDHPSCEMNPYVNLCLFTITKPQKRGLYIGPTCKEERGQRASDLPKGNIYTHTGPLF